MLVLLGQALEGQETPETQNGTQQPDPAGDQPASEPVPKRPQGPLGGMLVPLVLMFVVLYFFMLRGPKKKQQKHKQMLNDLKKNDRIRTIGGIVATVVEVRDDEVVIKIDESNNTKMHLTRNAIGAVLNNPEGN